MMGLRTVRPQGKLVELLCGAQSVRESMGQTTFAFRVRYARLPPSLPVGVTPAALFPNPLLSSQPTSCL